jgi:hypothetical protein
VKRDFDGKLADLLERPLRHAHLRALHFVAVLLQRLDDVLVGDGPEKAPVRTGLLR